MNTIYPIKFPYTRQQIANGQNLFNVHFALANDSGPNAGAVYVYIDFKDGPQHTYVGKIANGYFQRRKNVKDSDAWALVAYIERHDKQWRHIDF